MIGRRRRGSVRHPHPLDRRRRRVSAVGVLAPVAPVGVHGAAEQLAREAGRELRSGVTLAVLVARVPDDLTGQREKLVPAGQEGRHHGAELSRSLIHRNLKQ